MEEKWKILPKLLNQKQSFGDLFLTAVGMSIKRMLILKIWVMVHKGQTLA